MNEPEKTEENLRAHFKEEIGPVKWNDLERFFAAGTVIDIDSTLDLVEVAVNVTIDNSLLVKEWMDAGLVRRIEDDIAIKLMETDATVTGVVSRPWIFVQIGEL